MHRACPKMAEEEANEEAKRLHCSISGQGGKDCTTLRPCYRAETGEVTTASCRNGGHDSLQLFMAHTKDEHHRCPPGEKSWCHYQQRLAKYVIDGGAALPTTREPYLTPGEYARFGCIHGILVPLILQNDHNWQDSECE